MGGAGADRLVVMLAALHHLRVIERGDLRVPLSRTFRVDKRILLDQIWASLGDMLSFGLTPTTLRTFRHQPAPAAKVAHRRKALHLADKAGIHRRAILPDAFE